jgi:predicted ATPase
VQQQAEAGITFAAEQGFLYWRAFGTVLRGWALTEQGQEVEGITQLYKGLAAYRATGAEAMQPYFLALLAAVRQSTGRGTEGMERVAEALAAVDKTGERQYEAELYRLKGELTLAQSKDQGLGPSLTKRVGVSAPGSSLHNSSAPQLIPSTQAAEEAEACFHQAITVAQRQHAKSLELRAATSLARLWQRQGKKAEAHKVLFDVYHWFTEGFATKDLQEAKALLDELR